MNPINWERVVHKLPNLIQTLYAVQHARLIAKDVTQIILRPQTDSHINYQAGQYIKILHPDGNLSPLSIANAPDAQCHIELHLTHPAENLEAQAILRFVSDEKKLILHGPYGCCTIDALSIDKFIIFIARGTGFASIKAIIEAMQTRQKNPPMHFYWSVTEPQAFYLDELLDQWLREIPGFSYTPVLSRPQRNWPGKVGLLQEVVLQDYPEMANYQVYVSAPEPIVHDVLHHLLQVGLSRNQYYSDVFD